jgi:hypothetical protein
MKSVHTRVLAYSLLLATIGWGICANAAADHTDGNVVINIDDVTRFYKIYAATNGHPTAEVLQQYIDQGSEGLLYYTRVRKITGTRIAEAISKHPELYENARNCMDVLPAVRSRLVVVFHKLKELYPEAKLKPVTVLIGPGKPVAIADAEGGVQLALEGLCQEKPWMNPNREDRFVHIIAHEYAHVQQNIAFANDPHPTVLGASLMEGAAEFTAELTSGAVANYEQAGETKGHEKEIESEFAADEDSYNLSPKWLYNWKPDKPGDIGYWVGYRICKAYYQHAKDKKQAFSDILGITDPKAFLAKSGWYPGIVLQ